ncbi:GNAT family N-acetyltransferase [Streptomyces albipurpureus]|uniref:GNAT family N-acetyltransferase n=1 Tax=Streptomyces albipurpureus TaxID=2897419 RepID=A0ABT0UR86_9ACTN|nr:GNAT family N-acetyltransferase [Streptomyces sp. CWNU-1]MCM2389903.1 GNAT family N-acetyltransferase [Streptomyces sp. CWNU-1]
MLPDEWYLTQDVDDFLARVGDFLLSRPALHNTALTDIEKLRVHGTAERDAETAVFGRMESDGEVRAICYLTPRGRLGLTALSVEQTDTLATHLAGLGHSPANVIADHDTAAAFAESWQRHSGAAPVPFWRTRLYRLGTLTPPRARPAGRGRVTGAKDHEQVVRWCREFCAAVGERSSIDLIDAGCWGDSRFADRHFTFWETPDGTPVSMAAATSIVGGMVRVDPVYTPAHFQGRGYAGAVTVEVSRTALAAGATDVVLFTDPANPISNALYQRTGYIHVADFAGYEFSSSAPHGGQVHDRLNALATSTSREGREAPAEGRGERADQHRGQ